MQEIEFNLLTEPWVRVRLPDNTVQEVSLTKALVHAQEYMDLAGEMPTQDAAMLRLLLAVLFTVFSRVNEVGEPEPLEDEEAALERWGALWELKHFPEQPSGTIWSSGKTASGSSTRSGHSGRCRRQKLEAHLKAEN